jgi:hypothetical protein
MSGARLLVAAVLALVLLAPDIAAQRRDGGSGIFSGPIDVGPRVGRDFENHAWSAGALVRIPAGERFELRPSGDAFFPKDGKTGWQANGDGAILFGPGRSVYGGGGIALVHLNGDKTRTGYNLFGGITAPPETAGWKPFLEARWTFVNDTSPFRLVGGVTRSIGG